MKSPNLLLSLLILGPTVLGNKIEVYLQPLVDDLKELWNEGVSTYDALTKETFQLRAALLWTINDFLTYANLFGWSTKEKLACPICNKDTDFRRLKHGHKMCCMGHRRWLPQGHAWRIRKELFDGTEEHRLKPEELSGDQLLQQVLDFIGVQFEQETNSDITLNWRKKSVFFGLPYWSKLKLRHNLDVMHIEKNICDSVLGTLMNIDGKTKDTANTRKDLMVMGIHKELHLQKKGATFFMPIVKYTLTRDERKSLCEWLKGVKFPLAIHLPQEAELAGPVQFCWMYSIKRTLGKYKKGIETRWNHEERNVDSGVEATKQRLDVFSQRVQPFGAASTVILDHNEFAKARWYVLSNYNDMASYMKRNAENVSKQLYHLACRPDQQVRCKRENGTSTIEYYGELKRILELRYPGPNTVYLFECDWWSIRNSSGIRTDQGFTSVNTGRKCYESDPFILACQAVQVFYLDDPKLDSNWKVVQMMINRNIYDIPTIQEGDKEEDDQGIRDDAYQEDECVGGNVVHVEDTNNEESIAIGGL
ncbi:uncharacterized protein LOC133856781 [Alnus glutinosa]|uniref:uncharacterized protein LOC133856781 n=1 Tax=Alnus glutinosa TaxID=3517 RepID=UPI002D7912E2|nr:uncharacterized protein LOC133856781 [Alnus glutinosa]